MKLFIVLLIFGLLDNSWAEFPFEMFENVRETCRKEQKLNKEELSKLKITEEEILRKCFYEKLGYVKNGMVQEHVLMEQFQNTYLANKVKYMIRLCGHIIPNDAKNLTALDDCFDHISGDYYLNNWKRIASECKGKIKLSKDEYATLQYLPVKNITDAMKLYAKCALERHGFLKDNKFNEAIVLEVLEDYKDAKHLKEFVSECKGIKEDNENDTAFKLYKCLQEIEEKYVQSTEDEYKMVQKACLKENQLTPSEVYSKQLPSKPTPALKMFAKCVFEKMGYIKDGTVQPIVIHQNFERSIYPSSFEVYLKKCLNSSITDNQNENSDMTAYNLGLCFDLFSGEYFLKDWEKAGLECDDQEKRIRSEFRKVQSENPTSAMKYYAACVFKKLNFLKDNILQENVIMKVLDDYRDAEYLKMFLSKCKEINEPEHSYTAVKLFACMQKVIEEYKSN